MKKILKGMFKSYTIYKQKFSNLRPFLFITFPKEFRKSKEYGYWTSRSGGKKTFKWSEQTKKSIIFFWPWQFYTHYEQKFSNLRPLLSITFPQRFWKSKKFAHWTLWSGGKRPFKGVRNTNTKEILLSKAKLAQKQTFFCAVILHPLIVKVFKSETNLLNYLSPRILKL